MFISQNAPARCARVSCTTDTESLSARTPGSPIRSPLAQRGRTLCPAACVEEWDVTDKIRIHSHVPFTSPRPKSFWCRTHKLHAATPNAPPLGASVGAGFQMIVSTRTRVVRRTQSRTWELHVRAHFLIHRASAHRSMPSKGGILSTRINALHSAKFGRNIDVPPALQRRDSRYWHCPPRIRLAVLGSNKRTRR